MGLHDTDNNPAPNLGHFYRASWCARWTVPSTKQQCRNLPENLRSCVWPCDGGTYGEIYGAAASDVTEVKALHVQFQASIDWWVQSPGKWVGHWSSPGPYVTSPSYGLTKWRITASFHCLPILMQTLFHTTLTWDWIRKWFWEMESQPCPN